MCDFAAEIKKRQELHGQKRRLYERLNLSRTGGPLLLLLLLADAAAAC